MDESAQGSHEELTKACAFLRSNKIDFALLTSIENVTYISGFEVPYPIGPLAAFSGNRPLAFVLIDVRNETGWLLVADGYLREATKDNRLQRLASFETFNHFEPMDPQASYIESMRRILLEAGLNKSSAVLGIEGSTMPFLLSDLINKEFTQLQVMDARSSLLQSRRTKTKREIQLLREAARIADIGQQVLLDYAQSSGTYTEYELWGEMSKQMAIASNQVITITGELVTGPRITTVDYPGGPISRQVQAGDSGLLDISPRVRGYWADCANGFVFKEEPTTEQRRYFHAAREAFESAAELMRPGRACSEVEAAVRRTLARHHFPVAHYSGHQIGVEVNELPRLVPYDHSIIEAGMVFAIEPGAYEGKGGCNGARAERMVLVTDSGPEVLSLFPWGIH